MFSCKANRVSCPRRGFQCGGEIKKRIRRGLCNRDLETNENEKKSNDRTSTSSLSAGTENDMHHLHIRQIAVYDTNGKQLELTMDSASKTETNRGPFNAIDGSEKTMTESSPDDKNDLFLRYRIESTTTCVEKVVVRGVRSRMSLFMLLLCHSNANDENSNTNPRTQVHNRTQSEIVSELDLDVGRQRFESKLRHQKLWSASGMDRSTTRTT